jgi:ribonuclease HI
MKEVTIYCDGSSIGNPGPGGYGAVVADRARAREIGGYEAKTTNNRMELMAAIESIKLLPAPAKIKIHTDSRYVINGITKWVQGWERNNWQTLAKKDVLNRDLWQELMKAALTHEVTWVHVRGHEGVQLNERADMIANGFARKEKVTLFYGSLTKYQEFLKTMPKARAVASSSKKNSGKAFSYVSSIDGEVVVHQTWAECEKRVKGKNAKFKKALSKEGEAELIKLWE